MSKPRKPANKSTPKAINDLTHTAATRKNIPTAEYQAVMSQEQQAPIAVTYPRHASGLENEKAQRNPDHDPQLIWRGKDTVGSRDLVVHAPPIYQQEDIIPKVLIDDLRRFSDENAPPPIMGDLFPESNRLPEGAERTDFYQHEMPWKNKMILGDSLRAMASLAEIQGLRGKVQCIYLDPPYGIKFNSNFQWSTHSRDVKDGKPEHITREPEQVKAFRDTWKDGIHSYLTYLRDRLIVARDLLSESGSLFVQIGDENVHRVRCLMDEVFGDENFVSQITMKTSIGLGAEYIDNTANYILWFSKDKEKLKFRPLFKELIAGKEGASRYKTLRLPDLTERPITDIKVDNPHLLPKGYRLFRDQGLTSRSASGTTIFPVIFMGKTYRPLKGGWRTSEAGMQRVIRAERILKTGNNISYRKYFDDFSALSLDNFWGDVSGGVTSRSDPKVYVVQTANKAIQRCILMSTDPGD